MRCRNDVGAGFPKMMFYVECNQRFILDNKHELASKQIQWHRMSLITVQRLLMHMG